MKFGVREICDVVLKRKTSGWFGNLYLDKGMPAFYFDTLKTSSLEGAATTVYAQGGRGNPRLIAWEGDRTVTFTMEDALIAPESFAILSGAGLLDASEESSIFVHTTEQVELLDDGSNGIKIQLSSAPGQKMVDNKNVAEAYLMVMTETGGIDTYYTPIKIDNLASAATEVDKKFEIKLGTAESGLLSDAIKAYNESHDGIKSLELPSLATEQKRYGKDTSDTIGISNPLGVGRVVYVDYYVQSKSGVKQIEITADQFGGSYYLEASTLFRGTDGADYPAEFVIPNCKVQSNFTFTMAPTGDPSTFTFTMDAFPDYTKFDTTRKVIAAIQIVEDKDRFGKELFNTQASDPANITQ